MKILQKPFDTIEILKRKAQLNVLPQQSVEFFHIYTDEKINGRHMMSLEYLRAIEKTWSFKYEKIVLIDNYNPKKHILTAKDVIKRLELEGMIPDHWAYEADMLDNAKIFLNTVNNRKLQNSYVHYIDQHGKFPCSLLTATWYLTRLGYLDSTGVIRATKNKGAKYKPTKRLLNLLPQDYRDIEERARKLILKSSYAEAADKIQDLFYPIDSGRTLDLF